MRSYLPKSALLFLAAHALFVTIAVAHPASGIVVNAKGEVFFVHTGRGVCKIDAEGKQTYIHTESGGHFLAFDKDGKFSSQLPRLFERLTPAGATPALLYASGGAPFVVSRDGDLYYGSGYPEGDDLAPGGLTVARLSPDGKRTLFAPSLKAKLAELKEAVTGLAAGPDGSLFVACPNAILTIKADGAVSTLIHPVVIKDCDFAFDEKSDSPFFHAPYVRGLDVTEEGTIYAAVTGCRCVVKITPDGKVETVLKAEPSWAPTGVAVHGKDVFVLEYSDTDKSKGWTPRVRKLNHDGKVTTLTSVTSEDLPDAALSDSFTGSKAGEERETGGVKLCWCPAGKFTMGSPRSEPERRPGEDQVEVTLTKGFWMGKYEVTQGDWKRIVGDLPGKVDETAGMGDDFPVYNVNFAEAEEFCKKLTGLAHDSSELPRNWEFRLPTEAQWEYACRAGTTTATAFGNKLSSTQANFASKPYNGAKAGPSLKRATKVGSYPPNAWGLHDLHGNEVEWCRDWYHAKLPGGIDPDLSSVKGTPNRDGTASRARRGSAWGDDGWASRSAFRQRFEPERRADHIGIRIAAVQK